MTTTTTQPLDGASRALRGVLLLVGTVLLAGLLTMSIVNITAAAGFENQSGVYEIDEPVHRVSTQTTLTDTQVVYGDVDTATVDFAHHRADLNLEYRVQEGELSVEVRHVDRARFGPGFRLPAELTITLPRSTSQVDIDLHSTAGVIEAHGDFGDAVFRTHAGRVTLTGSATSVHMESNAGGLAATDFATTGPVTINSSVGGVTFLSSDLPESVDISASVSTIRFSVPAGEYDIRTDTGVGRVHDNLTGTPGAERVYRFTTTTGDIVLTEYR